MLSCYGSNSCILCTVFWAWCAALMWSDLREAAYSVCDNLPYLLLGTSWQLGSFLSWSC